jgi:hypothetical protein
LGNFEALDFFFTHDKQGTGVDDEKAQEGKSNEGRKKETKQKKAQTSLKGLKNYNAIYYIGSITSKRNKLIRLLYKPITISIIFSE